MNSPEVKVVLSTEGQDRVVRALRLIGYISARKSFGIRVGRVWIVFGRPSVFREGFFKIGRIGPGLYRLPGIVIVGEIK